MYLLEAKKRAEKEELLRRAQERQLQKQQEMMERKEAERQKKEAEKAEKEAKAAAKANSSRANEAKEALRVAEQRKAAEQAQMQEAMRRSREEAEAQERARAREERELQRVQQMSMQDKPGPAHVISSVPLQHDRAFDTVDSLDAENLWSDAQVGCKYVGTFEVGDGAIDRTAIKRGVSVMKQYVGSAREAILIICLEGIKVIDASTHKVAMAHALSRISMCSVDPDNALFGFVAKNPGVLEKYCHVFAMKQQRHADEVHALVSKAFKLAFAQDRTLKRKSQAPQQGQGSSTALAAQAGARSAAPAAPQSRPLSPPPQQRSQPQAGAQARPMSPPAQRAPQPQTAMAAAMAPSAAAAAAAQRKGGRQWAKHNPLQGMAADSRQPRRVDHQPDVLSRAPDAMRFPNGKPAQSLPEPPPPPAAAQHQAPPPQQSQQQQAAAAAAGAPQPKSPVETDPMLENASWYQAGIPREIAMELLELSGDGAFIVRDSQSQPGNFALTMKADGLMHHFIVRNTRKGFVLGNETDNQPAFADLGELILHYCRHKGCLPVALCLDAVNTLFEEQQRAGAGHANAGPVPSAPPAEEEDSFVDPAYQSLKELLAGKK